MVATLVSATMQLAVQDFGSASRWEIRNYFVRKWASSPARYVRPIHKTKYIKEFRGHRKTPQSPY
jgi:hypothetical protein